MNERLLQLLALLVHVLFLFVSCISRLDLYLCTYLLYTMATTEPVVAILAPQDEAVKGAWSR